MRSNTKKKTEETAGHQQPINSDYVKTAIREEIGRYLFQKTGNRPIILPVLIEV